ncbi:uncharacterized protein LOC107777087 [Nicotiana tabacum]|uniref:Uncharacterized protein LOC107777087 n=1 Tax=Nicotiana tabacum TaxID=4097 RepID=A0A1S3YJY9_TOBAC
MQLSINQVASNSNNIIWIFWDQEFTGTLLDQDEQQMDIELKHVEAGDIFYISIIDAKCKLSMRIPLWENLKLKSTTSTVCWCVIGDFNVITFMGEKIGGIPYQMKKSIDFINMIEECVLIDLGFYGPRYTWSNGIGPGSIVWKRPDMGMANDNWIISFPDTTITQLASAGFGHSPLLMEMHVIQDNVRKYFRFLKCWTTIWGHLSETKEYEQKINIEEEKWVTTNDRSDMTALHELQAHLIKGRKRKNFIHKIKDAEGDWIQGDEAIGEAVCDYFEELFTMPGGHIREDLLNCIPIMITNEDNIELSRDPDMKEFKRVVFSMCPSSAAGLDVMNGKFFQSCWEVIKDDLLKVVLALFLEEDA